MSNAYHQIHAKMPAQVSEIVNLFESTSWKQFDIIPLELTSPPEA